MASSGSHGLLVNSPLIFYPQSDFSDLLRHFVSSFINMLLSPYSIETMQLYEYYECFIAENHYEKLDLQHFLQTNEGYLKLNVSKYNNTRKQLSTIKINDNNYLKYKTISVCIL